MANQAEYKPVGDDVPQVDGAVAVGEDLEFQRRWWRFERVVWVFFGLVLLADLSGILGRGPLAKAERTSSDGSLQLHYERVEREGTPSMITLIPGQDAVQGGKFRLFVSEALLKPLGAQRVIPEPQSSAVGEGGVTYTFAATELPMMVQIELKPVALGTETFQVGVPGRSTLQAKTFVLP